MKYAHVVPVRRMPLDRPWLTYRIPDHLTPGIGHLVQIPLRGTPIHGIVWSLTDTPPSTGHLQDIIADPLPYPFLTPWQLRICDVLAQTGSASLGDVVYGVVPKGSLATYRRYFSKPLATTSAERSVPDHPILWYRNRIQAISALVAWAREHRGQQCVIVTPTKEDIERLVADFQSHGVQAEAVHATISPTQSMRCMSRIRNGEPVVLIGTLRALTMPFPHPPHIYLDQEEHHAHKLHNQHPRLDTRQVLRALGIPYSVCTPAPSLSTYREFHPAPPTATTLRSLFSLEHPHTIPWITDEVERLIDETDQHKRVIIIAPRRGYASTTNCRTCGHTLSCPSCGSRVSLFRGVHDQAVCHRCHTTISIGLSCTHCGSTDWTFHGLGIERIVGILQTRWPHRTISPVVRAEAPTEIMVDSYLAYHQLHLIADIGAVIVLCGDSLLNIPDYSTSERAWQYLSRLQAEQPAAPMAIQTFAPELPFWQRWLHRDDRAWYESELSERHRLHVPPFANQWIARFRGTESSMLAMESRITRDFGSHVDVTRLPHLPDKPHRLLITWKAERDPLEERLAQVFSTPWQLDRTPISWLD